MQKSLMLINAQEEKEVRIAIVQGERMEYYFVEREAKGTMVGNVYKGVVTDVRPALQAAFVDVGREKRGFLHASEIRSEINQRHKRPIQQLVREAQDIMVQVIRDEFGEKGASLTTDIQIPGRFLILRPFGRGVQIARRLEGHKQAQMLRRIVTDRCPPGMGFILRSAGDTTSAVDVSNDMDYLLRVWKAVSSRNNLTPAPALLYEETDFVLRIIREHFDESVQEVIVDDRPTYERVIRFFEEVMPRYKDRVRLYSATLPLFHKYRVEEQVQQLSQRTVPLESGGSLVIERTEALTSIDVNSKRFIRVRDPEELALKVNLDACREVMRQIRLRDIGGIIVIDFISMKYERSKRVVEQALREESKKDQNQMTILPMNEFGTIEIARQKIKPSLQLMVNEPCPACDGTGLLKDAQSMELEIVRTIKGSGEDSEVATIEVQANPTVVDLLRAREKEISDFEARHNKKVVLVKNKDIPVGRSEIAFYNATGDRIMDLIR